MLEISPARYLDESELAFEYYKATGPGGQNINKVSSGVRLRFNVQRTEFLDAKEKERLRKMSAHRLTEDGNLLIEAHRYRTQFQNRTDAVKRLVSLLNSAIRIPKARIKSHLSLSARVTRTNEKKKQGMKKRLRKIILDDWE